HTNTHTHTQTHTLSHTHTYARTHTHTHTHSIQYAVYPTSAMKTTMTQSSFSAGLSSVMSELRVSVRYECTSLFTLGTPITIDTASTLVCIRKNPRQH